MPIYQAIVLAFVQGVTEFLPVSSSAHLILIRRFFHWNELSPAQELTFDVALHAGTLIAVLLYFARTWWKLLRAAFGGSVRISSDAETEGNLTAAEVRRERALFWFLVAATIPGAIAGKLLESAAEDYFRTHVPLIAAAMILLALALWWSERFSNFSKPLTGIGLTDAMAVGCAQALAIIPGVSRSGSTITAGLFRNMTRDAAVRFSFLLSTPIIGGAVVLKAFEIRHQNFDSATQLSMTIGIAVSALVGWAAIAGFIRYLRTRTLGVFIMYRIFFGVLVLALFYLGYF